MWDNMTGSGEISLDLHYHLCACKYIFSNVYISVNTIFECSYLFLGWEIGHLLNTYTTGGMHGAHQECAQGRTGGEGYHTSYVRTHLHYLFSCFCLIVSCFIYINLTLTSFKKGAFVKNGYFSTNEIDFFYQLSLL